MPTISLSLPSFLNSHISSYFLPISTTTATATTTSNDDESPPDDPLQKNLPKPMGGTELRRVFDMFDQNGDGRITMDELRDSLTNMGIFIPDTDLSQMIAKTDVDGDGCVDGNEFRALYDIIMSQQGSDEEDDEEEEDLKDAFSIFDKNGDGFISVDELRSVLGSLGLNQGRNLEDFKLMIMKVDLDGDGVVSFKEFKKMMKQGGFASF